MKVCLQNFLIRQKSPFHKNCTSENILLMWPSKIKAGKHTRTVALVEGYSATVVLNEWCILVHVCYNQLLCVILNRICGPSPSEKFYKDLSLISVNGGHQLRWWLDYSSYLLHWSFIGIWYALIWWHSQGKKLAGLNLDPFITRQMFTSRQIVFYCVCLLHG